MSASGTEFRHLEPPPHPVDDRVRFPLRFIFAGMLILAGLLIIGGTGLTLMLGDVQLKGYTLEEPGLATEEPGLTTTATPTGIPTQFSLWCGLVSGICWIISGWTLWRNQLLVPVAAGVLALLLSVPLMLS